MIDDYIKKQNKLINSLPSEHYIHTVIITNGMRNDLANHPKLHIAMLELLSSGFTVKMGGIGSGYFVATKGKFEFLFLHSRSDKKTICLVSMNRKMIFEFIAESKCFYDFKCEKGRLYYDKLFLACCIKDYTSVDQQNIKKFGGLIR